MSLICWFCSNKFVVFNAFMESIMIIWSQNGIKMHSSYLLILYSGIPTNKFLPGSVHHRRVPGYPSIFPRPRRDFLSLTLNKVNFYFFSSITYLHPFFITYWSKKLDMSNICTIFMTFYTTISWVLITKR